MKMLERQYRLWDEAGIPVTKVGISDPMGWNMPDQVERQLVAIKKRWPAIKSFNLHLHNTRGMALTSSYVAMQNLDAGDTCACSRRSAAWAVVRSAATASPQVLAPTEDLIHMMEGMGIDTGVDLGQADRSGLARGRSRRPSALGACFQGRAKAERQKTLPDEYAVRRNAGACPPLYQRTCRLRGAPSPWKETINSPQRPDSMNGDDASAERHCGRWLPL